MIRLRALGTVDLRGDDGAEIRALLMQPKRLALFAYLALARPRGFQRRDTLVGIFWPDLAGERARPALNQAVYALRRCLGADVIAGRGADELSVAGERVWCDVCELEAALAAGDPARAVELYRGELLTGLVVPDAGEFERWLDGERKHWSSRILQAQRELTERAEAAGDLASAVGWARRTLDHAPYDEPALVRLMQLLARQGDRAAAIQACERFSDRLWNDVELRLSPATREVLSRIRREAGVTERATSPSGSPASAAPGAAARSGTPMVPAGARGLTEPAHGAQELLVETAAPLTAEIVPGALAGVPAPHAKPAARKPYLRVAAIAALAVLVVGVVGVALARMLRPPPAPPAAGAALTPTRVAVMYFDETDPAQHTRPLADGLTETLIDQLSHVEGLSVVSRNGVRLFRGTSVSMDSIRKVLHAPLLIGGSVSRSGDQVRVIVQLQDSAGNTLRSRTVASRWGEPFALMDTLSESVSGFLRQALGREIRLSQALAGTTNAEAWALYRRAEALRFQADNEDEQGASDQARLDLVEADSLLAVARVEDPSWLEPALTRAKLARKLAFIEFASGAGPTGAKARLEPALAALEGVSRHTPDNALALEQRGLLRYGLWLLAAPVGNARDSLHTAAERDLRRAVELQPDRADAWATLSSIDLAAGRLRAAKADAERAYGADAYLLSAPEVLHRLFRASFELHQDADARHACGETERRFGQTWYQAYCALTLMAWSERKVDPQRAWEIYDAPSRIDSPATRARTRPMLGMLLAAALARAGLQDSARHVIARAHTEASTDPEVLRLEAATQLLLGDSARAHGLIAAYTRDRSPGRVAAVRSRLFEPLSFNQGQ